MTISSRRGQWLPAAEVTLAPQLKSISIVFPAFPDDIAACGFTGFCSSLDSCFLMGNVKNTRVYFPVEEPGVSACGNYRIINCNKATLQVALLAANINHNFNQKKQVSPGRYYGYP